MSVGPCKTGGQHSNEIIDLFDNDFRSCDDVIEGSSTDSKLQWCKMKLSSYLALDFCTLVSSEDDVFQLAQLASKVVKDPKLTVDQLVDLNLVQEIPLLSISFLDANAKFQEAQKFL